MTTPFRLLLLLLLPCLLQAQGGPSDTVYRSSRLLITRLAPHTYIHTSYLQSPTFGRVACNGMVALHGGEAVVFDTPVDDSSSAELIRWIRAGHTLKAVVSTHFHEDCVGGLPEFHREGIPSYGSRSTITLAGAQGFPRPRHPFLDSLSFRLGGAPVEVRYLGAGHTADNVVGYFPLDAALFGGCLIKALGAGKGNLADADVGAWAGTVKKVKRAFPDARHVVPGHGAAGGTALLDYTIRLFRKAPGAVRARRS